MNYPELPFTVDQLAQEIRRIEGFYSLGAGAMAEVLMPFLAQRAAPVSEAVMVATDEHVKVLVEAQGYKFHKVPEDVKTRDRKAIQAVFDATTPQPVEVQPVAPVVAMRPMQPVAEGMERDELGKAS